VSDRSAELELLLRDKERVVAALTERLEQAAEQLDRFRRTGADRGLRTAAGIPTELIQNHEKLVEGMQQAVEQWEQAQPVSTLQRIEQRLAELQSMLNEGLVPAPALPASRDDTDLSEEQPAQAELIEESQPDGSSDDQGQSSWKQLKEQILAQERTSPADSPPLADSSTELAIESAIKLEEPTNSIEPVVDSASIENSLSLPQPEVMEPPTPIQIESASPGDLRQAVERRDDFIKNLIQRLRYAEYTSEQFRGWRELENTPDQITEELTALHDKLEQHLRLAEVEMAIERAKVGREAARLHQVEQQFRKQMGNAEASSDSPQASKLSDENTNRRWMRFFQSSQQGRD